MVGNSYSKYALKDLHQSIDLIDRKITHCKTFENFDTQENRESALRKLTTKRATLVKAAQALTENGVQYEVGTLPRSFLHPVENGGEAAVPEEAEKGEMTQSGKRRR